MEIILFLIILLFMLIGIGYLLRKTIDKNNPNTHFIPITLMCILSVILLAILGNHYLVDIKEYQSLLESNSDLKATHDELSVEMERLEDEVNTLTSEIDEFEDKHKELEADNKQLEKNNSKLQKEKIL